MPVSRLRPAAKSALAARLRKNGRWIKLWEMVFEFHHTPRATTGMMGAMLLPSVPEVQQGADRCVIGFAANARDAGVDGIGVRSFEFLAGLADTGGERASAEGDDLARSGDLFQIVPLLAGHLRVLPCFEIEVPARRRQIIVAVIGLGGGEHAPDLSRVVVDYDPVNFRIDSDKIAG